jgi:hypothetical protein
MAVKQPLGEAGERALNKLLCVASSNFNRVNEPN